MKTTVRRAYRCAICGAKLHAERWIYSKHSGERYCSPPDWAKCEARSLRGKA